MSNAADDNYFGVFFNDDPGSYASGGDDVSGATLHIKTPTSTSGTITTVTGSTTITGASTLNIGGGYVTVPSGTMMSSGTSGRTYRLESERAIFGDHATAVKGVVESAIANMEAIAAACVSMVQEATSESGTIANCRESIDEMAAMLEIVMRQVCKVQQKLTNAKVEAVLK